ncbi:MAG: flagellar basal body P-ring formation chaperone FlgA [Alphaproteobacteria bacterium]|nr:flagellar basal body P-ring formation chaperone FlgA [Alphaproteobacteria bacterium]
MKKEIKHYLTRTAISAFMGLSVMSISVSVSENAIASDIQEISNEEVSIIRNAMVQSNKIRLGDIFRNAGADADKIVAHAPELGQRLRFNSDWLWRVADFYKLDWKPVSKFDEVFVERASYSLDSAVLLDTLQDAIMAETGNDELIEIQVSGNLPEILLPLEADSSIGIKNFTTSGNGTRFSATYVAPANGKPIVQGKISGKVLKLVEVALPNKRLPAGHIIRESDLEIVTLQSRKVTRKALVHPEHLIGKQVRRSLIPGRPVLSSSIEEPLLVKKKSLVVVELVAGAMRLTTQATAMDDGSKKEVIRVKNTMSGQILEAVVIGYNKVAVISPLQSARM